MKGGKSYRAGFKLVRKGKVLVKVWVSLWEMVKGPWMVTCRESLPSLRMDGTQATPPGGGRYRRVTTHMSDLWEKDLRKESNQTNMGSVGRSDILKLSCVGLKKICPNQIKTKKITFHIAASHLVTYLWRCMITHCMLFDFLASGIGDW